MNEPKKSIWKISLHGPRGFFLAWIALMVAALIIFLIASLSGVALATKSSEQLKVLGVFELVATFLALLLVFIRWLCCWRNLKRFLFGIACLATVTALFYAEENWRGKHDWEHFKQGMEAQGVKLDFDAIVPSAVPDDQNFAMAPVFDAADKLANHKWREEHRNRNGSGWDTNLVDPLDITATPDSGPTNGIGDWRKGIISDLQPWQNYYRELAAKTNTYPVPAQPQSPAQDVLLALSRFNPVIEDLRQASLRPQSRFPLDYDDEDPSEILLPHLAALKRSSLILQLRAIAELQNNQPDKAMDDIILTLRLTDSIRTEPFIITHLVRLAILNIALQPAWEGLAAHKWSDPQLAKLDSAMADLDFLADYRLSVGGERAMHIKVLDWLEQKRSRYWLLFDMVDNDTRDQMNQFSKAVEIYLMPHGWYYQGQILIAQMDQQWIIPAADTARQTMSPQMIALAQTNINSLPHSIAYNLFARMLVPSLGAYARKAAYGQSVASLARTAIALERYRLAHGEFPESLDALSPQLMNKVPNDVIGGQPLKYRREANGQFVLYSVGWNETDDGGHVAFRKSSRPDRKDEDTFAAIVDLDKGDWVWQYPQ